MKNALIFKYETKTRVYTYSYKVDSYKRKMYWRKKKVRL